MFNEQAVRESIKRAMHNSKLPSDEKKLISDAIVEAIKTYHLNNRAQ